MKLKEFLLPEETVEVDGEELTLDQLADKIAEQGLQVLHLVLNLIKPR
jgi:hypothetical protein